MTYKRGEIWWYKLKWQGHTIRQSTHQGNNRVAERMEAAHRTRLAEGSLGIHPEKVPTLGAFIRDRITPHFQATFAEKTQTLTLYTVALRRVLAHPIAQLPLDQITAQAITAYTVHLQAADLATASVNRYLSTLRRTFHLAQEWSITSKTLPTVHMLPGEHHRNRVISSQEEIAYLEAASPLLKQVAAILTDCGLRPEECFRLRWDHITADTLAIPYGTGKTARAARTIPTTPRVQAILSTRHSAANGQHWVFPAPTASGHIEKSTLRKPHTAACRSAKIERFPLYTLRHTCLTRWAPHMDPWTLAYLAGHADMGTTRKYVHPQTATIQAALARVTAAQKIAGDTPGGTHAESGQDGLTPKTAPIN